MLAGNSRTYRGLSPVEFEKVLGGTAVNAGFSSGTYTEEYCNYLLELFNDDDSPKILIAGITHNALCELNRQNGFLNAKIESEESILSGKTKRNLDEYITAFDSILQPEFDNAAGNYLQTFYSNGYVSSDYQYRNPTAALKLYEDAFKNGQYSCTTEEVLTSIKAIQIIKEAGVHVYCLWIPTSVPMFNLENTESGMQRQAIAEEFKRAGFNWLQFNDEDYLSYDGSHLSSSSATAISQHAAIEVETQLKRVTDSE